MDVRSYVVGQLVMMILFMQFLSMCGLRNKNQMEDSCHQCMALLMWRQKERENEDEEEMRMKVKMRRKCQRSQRYKSKRICPRGAMSTLL